MSEPLTDPSKPFSEMVDEITRNPRERFGGACVFATSTGEVVSISLFGQDADPISFLVMIKARLDGLVAEITATEQRKLNTGFAQRR